jgi:phosphotriesterase-related protein
MVRAMPALITTLRDFDRPPGPMLPHEHVFVDFRTPEQPGYGEARADDVIALIAPELAKIKAQGVAAFVDCTPVGVGRRADIVLAVSRAADMPIVLPTGIYREPWVPAWARRLDEAGLADWLIGELTVQIEATGMRAAWIKLSANDDGMTPFEAMLLRAAARAGAATGAVIGSHSIRGRVAREQIDLIERAGYSAGRFIWIHASAEADFALNLELARRGAWIEYDWIGGEDDALLIDRVLRMLDAGFRDQLLLSQDRGWFDPAHPNGAAPGFPKPYTYLFETFVPKLRAAGVDAATIDALTVHNPWRAYAR